MQDRSAYLVRMDAVSKQYNTRSGGSVTALQDISVDIRQNQFITIVGPSGCGKSTMMKIAGGIIEPSTGSVIFDGHRLTRPSEEIGMVFQKATLLPWKTVLGNVCFPIEVIGLSMRDYVPKARALVD